MRAALLLLLLGSFEVLLVRIDELLQGYAHVLGQVLTCRVELHDASAGVVLSMPDDLVSCSLVEAEAEGRLVLPHLARDVIAAAQLIAEAVAVRIQNNAAHTTQGLCRQELDFGIGVIFFL